MFSGECGAFQHCAKLALHHRDIYMPCLQHVFGATGLWTHIMKLVLPPRVAKALIRNDRWDVRVLGYACSVSQLCA
jgi:hypothetical protein